MKRILLTGIIIVNLGSHTIAQTLGFDIPPEVCRGQNIIANNTSIDIEDEFYWDLCEGELLKSIVEQNTHMLPSLDQVAVIKTVFNGSEYITLALDRTANRLYRLNYGGDFFQTPTITMVIIPAETSLTSPQGMDIIQVDNLWHAFIANTGDSKIIRLDFGTSLLNEPTSSVLDFSGHLNAPVEVEIAAESGKFYVVVANFSSNSLVVADLGDEITNQPQPAFNVVALAGAGNPYGFSLKSFNDGNWRGVVGSFSNNNFHTVSFDNGLSQAPVVSNITSLLPTINRPVKLDLETWGDETVLVVMDLTGFIHRIQFDRGDLFNSVRTSDILNAVSFGESLALSLFYDQGKWRAITFGYTTKKLNMLLFDDSCEQVSLSYVNGEAPPIFQMNTSGIFDISLSAFQYGVFKRHTREISVLNLTAPVINIVHDAICSEHDVTFTATSPDQLIQFNWEFGDGGISDEESPIYQYLSANTYDVNLKAEAINGCTNNQLKSVKIYNQPEAMFTLPIGIVCTNNEITLTNNTGDAFDGNLEYEWYVNNILQSSDRDFSAILLVPGNQTVKLITSIPGCSSQLEQTVMNVVEGPSVAFSTTGQCEADAITFTNGTTGEVTGYSWNFDDGQISTVTNPVNVFANPGEYYVILTASNAAGCNNTASRQVTVYSTPQVNFTSLPPPFSCSGTPTQFTDLTPPPGDSNLNLWRWDFGDTGSPSNTSTQRNPQHTYATAADYTVELTITTNFLCSATLQKTITIHQAPTAALNHSALCEDAVVTFSDAASTNQSWSWQIGSSFYFTENPEHIFNNAGNYDVTLSVTGVNNCMGSTSETVIIPNKLNVDFSTLRSCVNQETEFTDLTNDSSDPITDVSWDFDGLGTATTTPATFIFSETGAVNVTLTVTTESGCEYPMTKPIVITPGPLAAFTANPNMGEAPLTIQFENNSLAANAFAWDFGDGSTTSVLASPFNTYEVSGYYTVQLIAQDLQSCMDTTRQIITVLSRSEVNPPSPNPSTGAFTIEWEANEETKTQLVLVDALGRVMRTLEVLANAGVNRYVLDITGEQSGLYILTIRYSNTVKTYRLMVAE